VAWSALILVLCGLFLAAPADARHPRKLSRYFEVKINGSAQLDSHPVCSSNRPCEGNYLTGHGIEASWVAYALVVYTENGRHRDLHLIGPEPRLAAYFTERTSYSVSFDECREDFSTGGGQSLSVFRASPLRLDYGHGRLTVDTGPPIDRHFSRCSRGTVSDHGANGSRAAWDGLKGPWHYGSVKAPTRRQLLHDRVIVVTGYTQPLGGEHTKSGWLHTSCCGSSLFYTFTRFPGGQKSVFRRERSFKRRHPARSHGFTKF
jgi:hypothetical protein